jgi:hypothetical protein
MLGFQYEASFQWKPILLMSKAGNPEDQLVFDGATESITIKGVGAGKAVTFCGETIATASVVVSALACNNSSATPITYSVINGTVVSANISADVGGFPEGSYTITKNY